MSDEEWYRRYQANQKVPTLPADNDDFDHAMAELRDAVREIAPDATAAISSILRILRHRRYLAAQVLHKCEPTCLNCGRDRNCLGCEDVRPEARKLEPGWRFFSQMKRWETVERVEQENEYAAVRVWTDKTGPGYSWLFTRWRKLDAVAPPISGMHGTPEIRIIELGYARDAPMYAVITLDTVYHPDPDNYLVEAVHVRGEGWKVVHRPDGGGPQVVIVCDSKAKARTALRAAARQHAKALGVKVVTRPAEK